MPLIRPRIRRLFHLALRQRRTVVQEVDDEVALHLTLRAEQLESTGLSPDEAREEAFRRFGVPTNALHTLHVAAFRREQTMNIRDHAESLWQDLRYAVRGLLRERAFTLFVTCTLALGLGVNGAMFGVVDRVLLRGPEHVRNWKQVGRLYLTAADDGAGEYTTGTFGYVAYDLLKRNSRLVDVAAYKVNVDGAVWGQAANARLVTTGESTADLLPLLGTSPLLGRYFTAEENSTTAPQHVAVLGYGLWQRDFGGSKDVLGQQVTLGGESYTVIGVMPRGYTGPELQPVDVWIPLSLRSRSVTPNWTSDWCCQWLRIVMRPHAGVTMAQMRTDATSIFQHGYSGDEKNVRMGRLAPAPLLFDEGGTEPPELGVARWLLGVTVVVLLIACANVVNLMLARAVRRQREVAVRLALGVSRMRLLRLFLVESVLLSLAGGALGLGIAYTTGQFIRRVLMPNVDWPASPVASRVLLATALLSLVAGVVVGLLPALQSTHPSLTDALKSGAREGGGRRSRVRMLLTTAQAALSVVLLIGAGLFVRSLANVRALDLGIEPERVLVISPRWPRLDASASEAERGRESARRRQLYPAALERVRHLGGVEHASLTVGLPFQNRFSQKLSVPGWDSLPKVGGQPNVSAVTSEYFETIGTRLLQGRAFTPADRDGSEAVTIVSATMAKTLWPGANPLGACLYAGERGKVPCARIVGVVRDARRGRLREKPSMHYYLPFGQERDFGGTVLLVRPEERAASLIPAVRRALQELDPTISYVDVDVLQDYIDPQVRPWRLGASMFSLMGVLALLVAAVGLYSVISYLVAQRTRELGVRVALGATGASIMRLVIVGGVGSAAMGVALGVLLALGGGRFIEPMLFDTSAADLVVFSVVAGLLLLVALLACLLPALRAGRVNPMEALRAD